MMIDYIVTTIANAFAIAFAVVVVVFISFKWRYLHWKGKGIPFIEPSIPFGNLGNPFVENRNENVAKLYQKAKSKGLKYCGIFSMLTPILLIVDINLAKQTLVKDFQYFIDRAIYVNEKDPLGCHLIALPGSKWKTLRARLTPTFSSAKLKAMFQILVDCGSALEKNIEEIVKRNQPVDTKVLMQCFSTDVIGSSAFGIDCNSFKEPNNPFVTVVNKYVHVSIMDVLEALFTDNFPRFSQALGFGKVKKEVSDFFIDLVEKTVSYREENNIQRQDFMQLLMNLGKGFDDDYAPLKINEIAAQSFVFFVGGAETTATTLSWVLFELAMHPEVQDRLRDEIQEILVKYNGKITYELLNDVKYMGQVIDETLRFRVPVTAVDRICNADYKVPGEDLVITKGTKLIFSIKGIQHDEEYWFNPHEFDPDRFDEKNKDTWNQFCFLPFGQGPKTCIGEKFGRMSIKVALTSILRTFRVTLNERTQLPLTTCLPGIISSSDGDIWLNFVKI